MIYLGRRARRSPLTPPVHAVAHQQVQSGLFQLRDATIANQVAKQVLVELCPAHEAQLLLSQRLEKLLLEALLRGYPQFRRLVQKPPYQLLCTQ